MAHVAMNEVRKSREMVANQSRKIRALASY
jgi:hypothetical protein